MTDENLPANQPPEGQFLLYQTEDGETRIECRLVSETIWLTQRLMSDLFQVTVATINEHLKNLANDREIDANRTIRKFLIVQTEGKREVSRQVDHYSLDAILAVGFRVRSTRGTQFRVWANHRLQEFLVKGFARDDERLKAGGGGQYFEELLARIRDIRSSERVSGVRFSISTPQASTTILPTTRHKRSSRRFRTRCIGRLTGIQQPRSCTDVPTRINHTWD